MVIAGLHKRKEKHPLQNGNEWIRGIPCMEPFEIEL